MVLSLFVAQMLTYWLTFTYQRATRTVSIPPPAYYAHLAAFRARMMISRSDSDVESVASGGTSATGPVTFDEIHKNLFHTMFFM